MIQAIDKIKKSRVCFKVFRMHSCWNIHRKKIQMMISLTNWEKGAENQKTFWKRNGEEN